MEETKQKIAQNNSSKKPLVIIFLTVFIYLLGFGIIIPILPLLSVHLGASAFQTGLLMSVYSLMQFIFSPIWGRLSDRYGRRPILLISLGGEVIAYIIFALARNLEWLFFARILSGFFGASISTASAYVSDITTTKERSKGMALIGAAFGLGFLFGPAIGGGLTVWAQHLSPDPFFRTSFSSYWVSGLCLATFIFAYKFLPETVAKKNEADAKAEASKKRSRWEIFLQYFKTPVVGSLILAYFFASVAMSMMESTLVLFMKDKFNWGVKEVSFGFAYIGVIMVFTQGYLVRKLIPKMGEKHVLRLGLISLAMGFIGIALANSIAFMAVTQTLVALGLGFLNPATLGSISLLTPNDQQGAVLGTTQGMSSLGRIIGPAMGGALFGSLSIVSPYIASGSLAIISLLVVISIFKQIPNSGHHEDEAPTTQPAPEAPPNA